MLGALGMTDRMLLNCDMGESFGLWQMGQDETLMPWIDQASIACCFHAGDPDVMASTIKLAKKHNISIGAHPSYADLQGFGRRSIPHTPEQIQHLITYQCGALMALCYQQGASVDYIKPHGALYHDMMCDSLIFEAILQAVAAMQSKPKLMIQALKGDQAYQALAKKFGVVLLLEAFADRRYTNNGQLMPRSQEGAVFTNIADILAQVRHLKQGQVQTVEGKMISLKADSICIHGDNPASVQAVSQIAKLLKPDHST